MPSLYEILKKNELKKYPTLPGWVLQKLKTLEKGSEDYVEFTSSIAFNKITGRWSYSLIDP